MRTLISFKKSTPSHPKGPRLEQFMTSTFGRPVLKLFSRHIRRHYINVVFKNVIFCQKISKCAQRRLVFFHQIADGAGIFINIESLY